MADILDRLSLSSCWCSRRHTDGYEMIREMRELGFKRIELSHGIRLSLVPGILEALEEGMVEVSSIHNFCPLPGFTSHPAPNLYQPSTADFREFDLWNRYSIQTLNFAHKLGVKCVVMHSGSVSFFFRSVENYLKRWIRRSGMSASEFIVDKGFIKRRDKAMKAIRKASLSVIPRVVENYKNLLPEAKARGIRLCLENREGLEEMPMDDVYDDFLNRLGEPEYAGYWHDTGHAQAKQRLGLLDHRKHLEKMAPGLIGFHLHDVNEAGQDHLVPGTGEIDFKMISEFVSPKHIVVLELSPGLTPDQVLESRDYIAKTFA